MQRFSFSSLFFFSVPFLFAFSFAHAQDATFGLSFTPSASSVTQGASTNTSININGFTANPVLLAVSQGLPAGVTVKFSPTSCKAPCNSIMTVTTVQTAASGVYTIPVIGAVGGETASASFMLTVNALPQFDFGISLTSSFGYVATGESVSTSLNVDHLFGTSGTVTLSASGLPAGVTAKFSTATCKPPCSATVTFAVSSVTSGTYPITISATAGNITREALYYLQITPVPLSDFSLSFSPFVNVILKGGIVNPLLTVSQISGTSQNVMLTIGNQLANATAKLTPASCKPPCSAVLAVTTKPEIKPGTYSISVLGSAGGIARNAEYQLIVIDPSNTSAILPVGVTSGGVSTGGSGDAIWKTLPPYTFNTSLYKGSKGREVEKLQQYLSADKNLYPEGIVTGYFGALTEKAVGRFQIQYGIVDSTSHPGWGSFGPRTRAKMNALLAR